MTAPFGIEINQPLSESLIVSDLGGGKYQVDPPKPHPAFKQFFVENSKTIGVVWLKGVASSVENDAYGTGVQQSLVEISAQLSSRYGQPRVADTFKVGAIWTEPREWVSSLMHKERFFFHIWERGKVAGLPDDLDTIFLSVAAYSSTEACVFLEYASSRQEEANQLAQSDLADLL